MWLKLETTHISLVAGDYFVKPEELGHDRRTSLAISCQVTSEAICLDLENFFRERNVKL